MEISGESPKQKVIYILPSTIVSSPMSRMSVLSQYRQPIVNMQVCFGENYQVKASFVDNIKIFEEDTIYLLPEQLRHVVDAEKILKVLRVPSSIFSNKVLDDIRRKVVIMQIQNPI